MKHSNIYSILELVHISNMDLDSLMKHSNIYSILELVHIKYGLRFLHSFRG
jgi:hypothetical protein